MPPVQDVWGTVHQLYLFYPVLVSKHKRSNPAPPFWVSSTGGAFCVAYVSGA